jgi:hypothetical protein
VFFSWRGLQSWIEHDAFRRACKHRLIGFCRPRERIDVGGKHREGSECAGLEARTQRLEDRCAVCAVKGQRSDANEAMLAAVERKDVEGNSWSPL